MALNDIIVPKETAGGSFIETILTPAEINLGPSNNVVFQSLSTQSVTTDTVNVQVELLSANVPLQDIFITAGEESQTLTYNITGESLAIDRGNTVSLSSLSYRTITATLSTETIQQFANSYSGDIHPGFNVTLNNGRVYTFGGTDKNNPNHYLEVNANPFLPIYREVPLSGNEVEIDSFRLADFKTAKYTLQVGTNFNNEVYYSEINVVGSAYPQQGVASEYGQIFTSQLVLNYMAEVDVNRVYLYMYHPYDPDPSHKYFVKGHRTNLYKI